LYVLDDDGKELCVSAEDNFGGFLFRAVRHRIVLLPEEQYASFFVLLTTRSFVFSTWIGSILDTFSRKYFTHFLLTVLLSDYDLLLSFIEVVVGEQMQRENESTLFRCDSFCTCCISTVLRMIGRDLAVEELKNFLSAGQPKQEVEIMVTLKSLSEHLPLLFRAVLSRVVKSVKANCKDRMHNQRRVVSAFFILRFVNPILAFWNDGCAEQSRQMAKTIQLLANQAASLEYKPVRFKFLVLIFDA
uniref:Ras-GAP domain-containing protein n=1 Tax=Gongylonema pulchrum TaxID=637853 RepID=A0A183EPQ7_9BILA